MSTNSALLQQATGPLIALSADLHIALSVASDDELGAVVREIEEAGRFLDHARAVAAAEVLAVEFARAHSANLVKDFLIALRELLDPDGLEPREEEARALRAFRMGREKNGMVPISGVAISVNAGLLHAAFAEGANPKAQPRFSPEDESREQRQFDILMGTLRAVLRTGETTTSSALRPLTTVMVVVTADDLAKKTGAGWIDDVNEPVGAVTVQQLACDAGITPIFLGSKGQVLYLGTPVRLFSRVQRQPLAVRDGGCVWLGCSAPPSWCEAHHVQEYEQGGKTDIDNGVLLCSGHHHMLHASQYFMKMIDGKPRLLAPAWLDPGQHWQPVGRTRALLQL